MERNVTMAEISDGKLYSRDDMVKVGCDDCRGCSACCHGMGNSIVLDPYDVYRLTTLRGDTLEHLLEEKKVEWNVCLLYTSPSPRDGLLSRMPSSA